MRVKSGSRLGSLQITADHEGLVSRSGSALVGELAARLGLERELSSGLSHLFRRRPLHDPGRVLVDLATMLIDGGDCVSDLGALAEQPELFGRSRRTRPRRGCCTRSARRSWPRSAPRAAARASGPGRWGCARRRSRSISTRSCWSAIPRRSAAPHRKGGFGFHPLHCFLDETGERWPGCCGLATPARTPPPTMSASSSRRWRSCRPISPIANASSRCRSWRAPTRPALRTPSRGAARAQIRFSLGYYVDERVGQAALALPKKRWCRVDADGREEREEPGWPS